MPGYDRAASDALYERFPGRLQDPIGAGLANHRREPAVYLTLFHMDRARNEATQMNEQNGKIFDPAVFLAHAGLGRRIVQLKAKGVFFSQGSSADSIFYLQKGRAKLTVVSQAGKQATVTLLAAGDFVGEESVAGVVGLRLATATAITACSALKIERKEMLRVIHEEHSFSDLFVAFPAGPQYAHPGRSCRSTFQLQRKAFGEDSSLMAEFGQPGKQETLIPHITQETLADMIGTTRSRVSLFMNRFRKHGFIEYNGRIRVHKSLLNVVLHDQPSDQNSRSASLLDPHADKMQSAKHAAALVNRRGKPVD